MPGDTLMSRQKCGGRIERRAAPTVPPACSFLVVAVVACSLSNAFAQQPIALGGDAIGPDEAYTANTGGFTAVMTDEENLGHPAVLVALDGDQFLANLRVIVFGLPSASGNLYFDQFEYHLDFWTSTDFLANQPPEFSLALGDPLALEHLQLDENTVVPGPPFGTAGPLADDADTYDLRFDLTPLFLQAFESGEAPLRLAEGDWVIGFQSRHEVDEVGVLRVSASNSPSGPVPMFNREDMESPGVLGDQHPDDISIRWGITLSAVDALPGDFDDDDDIDENDLAMWGPGFGVADAADTNWDGDSDGADLLTLQRVAGTSLNPAAANAGDDADEGPPGTTQIPAPVSSWLLFSGLLTHFARRPRRQ